MTHLVDRYDEREFSIGRFPKPFAQLALTLSKQQVSQGPDLLADAETGLAVSDGGVQGCDFLNNRSFLEDRCSGCPEGRRETVDQAGGGRMRDSGEDTSVVDDPEKRRKWFASADVENDTSERTLTG